MEKSFKIFIPFPLEFFILKKQKKHMIFLQIKPFIYFASVSQFLMLVKAFIVLFNFSFDLFVVFFKMVILFEI